MERIRITRLGAKGDGVADNGVFASGALPGELIEGEIAASCVSIVVGSQSRSRWACCIIFF